MFRKLSLLFIVLSICLVSSPQLLVKPNGNVAIGLTNTSQNIYEKLGVYSNTSQNTSLVRMSADSCTTGLYLSMGNQPSTSIYRCGLSVYNELNPNSYSIGIETDNNAIIKGNSFFGNNTELIVK